MTAPLKPLILAFALVATGAGAQAPPADAVTAPVVQKAVPCVDTGVVTAENRVYSGGPRSTDERGTKVFVAQSVRRPLAAFEAEGLAQAQQWAQSDGFKSALLDLRTRSDQRIWDGKAAIQVRAAAPDEDYLWQKSRMDAIQGARFDPGVPGALWCIYLPAVKDIDPAH